jgi:hypothetical protein
MLRMPPFTASVEKINFHHSFFGFETSVDLLLRPRDGLMPLDTYVISAPSDRDAIGFAHWLATEWSYDFPQAYVDYVNRTNAGGK